MPQRRTGPIPLARWLTSGNSVLREKAETALYHLGPDAGKVLLHAAEQEAKWAQQRRVLLLLPVEALAAVGAYYLVHVFVDVQSTLLLGMVAYIAARASWQLLEGTISRRNRLRTLALALARRNDLRSIGPMIDVWCPIGAWGQPVHDDDIEHELNRLLPQFLSQNRLTLRNDALKRLRDKVRRLSTVPAPLLNRADLSDERADLLVTLLQLFARMGGEKNRTLLRRTARLYVRDSAPNLTLIRDSAHSLLAVVAVPGEAAATPQTPSGAAAAAPPRSASAPVSGSSGVPLSLRRP